MVETTAAPDPTTPVDRTGRASPRRSRPERGIAAAVAAVAALALLVSTSSACLPVADVTVDTVAYPDGSLDRRVHLDVRSPEDDGTDGSAGDEREDRDALAEAKIDLVEPDAWDRLERGPTSVRASGWFPDAAAVPGILRHEVDGDDLGVPDRSVIAYEVVDLVVAELYRFTEAYGDPYDRAAISGVLDESTELVLEALRSEVARDLDTDEVDVAAMERLVRVEGRALAYELLSAQRSHPGLHESDRLAATRRTILESRGVRAPGAEPDDLEALATAGLAEAARALSGALSTADRTVVPQDVALLEGMAAGEIDALVEAIERVWGEDAEDTIARLEDLWRRLAGFHSDSSVDLRLRWRVRLPGRLLATSGAPAADGAVVWFARGTDLVAGDAVARAESIVLDDEALRRAGARRSFATEELLELVDLLTVRDRDGLLRRRLAAAVERGDLAPLDPADGDETDGASGTYLRELATLLRPDARRNASSPSR